MTTFASLFSGFGGADLGAITAGLDEIWGVELDDAIASIARLNGLKVQAVDILECDPRDFERADILHASPPCPNFSNAKANGEETAADIALAEKVAEFVAVLLPEVFTLENVYPYRNSQSWSIIAQMLMTRGYSFNYWHVNTADYGVPQTRKRMIVIARRDGIKPMLPPATHAENPANGLFGRLEKWVGWYEAIQDLIPGLPESKFAKWQLERLPRELASYLTDCSNAGRDYTQREPEEPAPTVTTELFRRPSTTPKAFIAPINGEATNGFYADEPAQTIASNHGAGKYRAFIVDGKLSTSGDERKLQVLDRVTPHATVVASQSAMKDSKAYISGRVVQMTHRALARFQSFPDWYELPNSKRLACKGIGNAVPPLFAQRLFEKLVR